MVEMLQGWEREQGGEGGGRHGQGRRGRAMACSSARSRCARTCTPPPPTHTHRETLRSLCLGAGKRRKEGVGPGRLGEGAGPEVEEAGGCAVAEVRAK
eukprot:2705690-Rhodomonas_salina.1